MAAKYIVEIIFYQFLHHLSKLNFMNQALIPMTIDTIFFAV